MKNQGFNTVGVANCIDLLEKHEERKTARLVICVVNFMMCGIFYSLILLPLIENLNLWCGYKLFWISCYDK